MSLRRLFALALLVILLPIALSLVLVASTWADIAPFDPPSGSNPEPDSVTNVRMVSETVVIVVDADSPYDSGLAKVTATFQMKNLGGIEEKLTVRFPLDLAVEWGRICSRPTLEFSPITDLSAYVNGRRVATTKDYQTAEVQTGFETYTTVTRPCWELFDVTFPPAEDVIIQVKYTAQPYTDNGAYEYSYILGTGAGWKGTIGTADITVRLPYALDPFNFIGCYPNDCLIVGNEIRWRYEDFEPESPFEYTIRARLLPPPLWQRILVENDAIAKNPNDGEAWGRLAKAYKESIRERRGFRSDKMAMELYKLSDEAYQKALALLPRDADWHYGYADLLCWNAEWNRFFTTEVEALQACAAQVKRTLEVNPYHEKANALLQYLAQFDSPRVVNISEGTVVYSILTPRPTATATATRRPTATIPPTHSQTPAQVTPSAQPTKTLVLPSPSRTAQNTPTATPTQQSTTINNNNSTILLFGVAILAVIVGIRVLRQKK